MTYRTLCTKCIGTLLKTFLSLRATTVFPQCMFSSTLLQFSVEFYSLSLGAHCFLSCFLDDVKGFTTIFYFNNLLSKISHDILYSFDCSKSASTSAMSLMTLFKAPSMPGKWAFFAFVIFSTLDSRSKSKLFIRTETVAPCHYYIDQG